MTSVNLKPGVPGSGGHPSNLLSGPRYAWALAAPARPLTLGSATGRQPTPIEYPSGPRW
jgi:hypothetical protein